MVEHSSRVVLEGLAFGESPRWHDDRLWFSDFYRHGVFSLDVATLEERREVSIPGQPSGLAWAPDGALLVVSMTDHRLLRVTDGPPTTLADLSDYCGFWANDLLVGPRGHAYVGNFGFDLDALIAAEGVAGLLATPPPTTNLVVLDPNGAVRQVVADMSFPNGAVLTPDGATLIVAETLRSRLSAFRVADDGTLHDRRVFADLGPVAPDGICLDAEGCVWVANAVAPEVRRVAEGGAVLGRVTTTQPAFACALGGTTRTTLFVMTAPTSSRFVVADARDGAIEAVEVGVPGAGWP